MLALVIFEDCDLSVMTVTMVLWSLVTMVLWSLASLHFYLTCSHAMAERRSERLSQDIAYIDTSDLCDLPHASTLN